MDRAIIYRLKRYNMINCESYIYYNTINPYSEAEKELFKFKGIDFIKPIYPGNDHLHVYKNYIERYSEMGELKFIINIPFNIVTIYNFYIDYLYYANLLNRLNFIILINKKYLISTLEMELSDLTGEIINSRWNEYTHRSIYIEFKLNIK